MELLKDREKSYSTRVKLWLVHKAPLALLARRLGVLEHLQKAWIAVGRAYLVLEVLTDESAAAEYRLQPLNNVVLGFKEFSLFDSDMSLRAMKDAYLIAWSELSRSKAYDCEIGDENSDRAVSLLERVFFYFHLELNELDLKQFSSRVRQVLIDCRRACKSMSGVGRRSKMDSREATSSWIKLDRQRKHLLGLGLTRVVVQLWNGRVAVCGFPQGLDRYYPNGQTISQQSPLRPHFARFQDDKQDYDFLDIYLDSRLHKLSREQELVGENRSKRGKPAALKAVRMKGRVRSPFFNLGFEYLPGVQDFAVVRGDRARKIHGPLIKALKAAVDSRVVLRALGAHAKPLRYPRKGKNLE